MITLDEYFAGVNEENSEGQLLPDVAFLKIVLKDAKRERAFITSEIAQSSAGMIRLALPLFQKLCPDVNLECFFEKCIGSDESAKSVYNFFKFESHPNKKPLELITYGIFYGLQTFNENFNEISRFEYFWEATIHLAQVYLFHRRQRESSKKPRPDKLNILLKKIITKNPDISYSVLLSKLKDSDGIEVDERDDEITFDDGVTKPKKLSGLKSRMYRIKKASSLTG